jgi:hypothetical protein
MKNIVNEKEGLKYFIEQRKNDFNEKGQFTVGMNKEALWIEVTRQLPNLRKDLTARRRFFFLFVMTSVWIKIKRSRLPAGSARVWEEKKKSAEP